MLLLYITWSVRPTTTISDPVGGRIRQCAYVHLCITTAMYRAYNTWYHNTIAHHTLVEGKLNTVRSGKKSHRSRGGEKNQRKMMITDLTIRTDSRASFEPSGSRRKCVPRGGQRGKVRWKNVDREKRKIWKKSKRNGSITLPLLPCTLVS